MNRSNLYAKIVNPKVMRIVFIIAALLYVLYQCDINPRMDDDFLGEQAYWMARVGYVKTELMRGYNGIGQENYQSVFHKFMIYNGALAIRAFGWSIYSLHLVGYLYFLLFIPVFYRFIKRHFPDKPELFYATLVIMLINHEFATGSGTFRPEVMIMTLGFGSYCCLDSYLHQQRGGAGWLVLAAVLSGLCFLTHLNGLIFIVAGFILLLSRRRYGPAILFGAIATLVFSTYFIDIFLNADLHYFLWQFRNDPALSGDDFSWYSPLLKLAMEQARFLYNERELPYSIALFAALVFSYKYVRSKLGPMLLFTGTLVITLALYTYSKTPQYLIMYAPYFGLIYLLGWEQVEAGGKAWQKWIIRAFTLAFVCINTGNVLLKISNNIRYVREGSVQQLNSRLAAHIPGDHARINVLAANEFVFNELGHFHRIMTLHKYNFYQEFHNRPLPGFNALLDSARKYDIPYIVFSEDDVMKFGVRKELQQPAGRFRLLDDERNHIVIGLLPDSLRGGASGTSLPPR